MKRATLTLIVLNLVSAVAVARTNVSGSIPNHMICTANRMILGKYLSAGEVRIRIDSSQDLLVEATFRKSPKMPAMNFMFGRGVTGGQNYSGMNQFNCSYIYNESQPQTLDVKYVCKEGSRTVSNTSPYSSFSYQSTTRQGQICRATLTGSTGQCWELRNCH